MTIKRYSAVSRRRRAAQAWRQMSVTTTSPGILQPEYIMPIRRLFSATVVYAAFLSGCVSLAPGADKVRLTKNEADLWGCSALGNIELPGYAEGQITGANADAEFRNQAVSVGGNAALVTYAPFGSPIKGVAYRCP